MNLFELFFVLLVLTGLVSLLAAGGCAVLGRLAAAGRIVRRVSLGAVLYLGAVLLVSVFVPRTTRRIGEVLRFDDWCLTVEAMRTKESPGGPVVELDLRLASQARRVPQREAGVRVSLSDDAGQQYEPLPAEAGVDEVPLDVMLAPGASVLATRRFRLPAGAHASGLVVSHAGFPIRWLLLGQGPFVRAPLVRLEHR